MAGDQVTSWAKELNVNVALVLDDEAFHEPMLDFAKVDYVGIGYLTVVPAASGS